MKIAFKRRSCSNRRVRTLNFRQNRVNGYDLLAALPVSTLKTACTTFGVKNAMKITFKRRSCSNRRERTLNFRQNRVNGYDLRAAVPLAALKTACTTFGVQNAMKIASKRRNSSNRMEITLRFRQNSVNGYDLRAAVSLAALKTACTTFGV